MFSPNLEHLVHEEYEERLRQLEQQHQAEAAQAGTGTIYKKATHWLGSQMVKWGSKLQGH